MKQERGEHGHGLTAVVGRGVKAAHAVMATVRRKGKGGDSPCGKVSAGGVVIPSGAKRLGAVPAGHEVHLTVVLAARTPLPALRHAHHGEGAHFTPNTPGARAAHLTHAQLREAHGAAPEARRKVEEFAARHHLSVREDASERRSVSLSGRAADVERAFKTKFAEYSLHGERFRAPEQAPSLPRSWDGVVQTVLGLGSSAQVQRHRTSMVHGRGRPAQLAELADAYAFPQGLDGSGETIGLIELGGGFDPADVARFCERMGIRTPKISVVAVPGGKNRPAERAAVYRFLNMVSGELALAAAAEGDDFQAAQSTVEVTMDVEIVAALAPGAKIVVYFAPPGEQGLFHAISRAVHDEHHRPSILSISWSTAEECMSPAAMHAIEEVLREAAHLGITICASSGDDGALNGAADGKPSVNYPASSPYCLACGGTSGKVSRAEILDEVVWNSTHYGIRGASGGGVSKRFKRPAWQASAKVPRSPAGRDGRGLPDVAGLADPRYGCELLIANRVCASAGTSAVAPMWAALVARLNQGLGRRCGHLHSHLYRLGETRRRALRPVVKGNNDVYHAGEGWNACAGYGTPRGEDLLEHLREWMAGDAVSARP